MRVEGQPVGEIYLVTVPTFSLKPELGTRSMLKTWNVGNEMPSYHFVAI